MRLREFQRRTAVLACAAAFALLLQALLTPALALAATRVAPQLPWFLCTSDDTAAVIPGDDKAPHVAGFDCCLNGACPHTGLTPPTTATISTRALVGAILWRDLTQVTPRAAAATAFHARAPPIAA